MDALVNSEANARRIRIVEECFGNGVKLYNAGRVLVGEGVLNKQCRKKMKPRQFFLFNDILVYGNIVIHRKKYTTQHVLALPTVKLVDLEDEDRLLYGWQIITPTKSFAVHAASLTEKKEWMAHIQRCIDTLRGNTAAESGDASALAPVWISDVSAPFCMLCTKTKFTLLSRRHHCRKCGAVVCSACSTKRCTLLEQSEKPLRVCDTCYQQITSPGSPHVQTYDFKFKDEPDSDEENDLYKVPKSVMAVGKVEEPLQPVEELPQPAEGATASPAAPVAPSVIPPKPDELAPVLPTKKKLSTHKHAGERQETMYGSSDDEDDPEHDAGNIESTAPTFYSAATDNQI